MIRELFSLHRRAVLIAAGVFGCLLLILAVAATAAHFSTHGSDADAVRPVATASASPPVVSAPTSTTRPSVAPSVSPASDVARWDAMTAIHPATSRAYPAISAGVRRDPDAYAGAFARELFTRTYRGSTRAELVSWVQSEDAPLRSPSYPSRDWSKVLVDSLTDLTWDSETQTPIPADGPWLALQAQNARQTVSDVRVGVDPEWEQRVAAGYQPPDPLTTIRDVTLTLTRVENRPGTTVAANHGGKHSTAMARFSVSVALQLGTSPQGGYGAAATNDYVVRAMRSGS